MSLQTISWEDLLDLAEANIRRGRSMDELERLMAINGLRTVMAEMRRRVIVGQLSSEAPASSPVVRPPHTEAGAS